MFWFGVKCAQCGMKLRKKYYEWRNKKFCCLKCKKAYRKKVEKRCH
jgi:hypothetical protein